MSTDLCCIEEKRGTEVILRIVDKESKEVSVNLRVAFAHFLNKEELKILIDGHLCKGRQFLTLYSYLLSIWLIMDSYRRDRVTLLCSQEQMNGLKSFGFGVEALINCQLKEEE